MDGGDTREDTRVCAVNEDRVKDRKGAEQKYTNNKLYAHEIQTNYKEKELIIIIKKSFKKSYSGDGIYKFNRK